jgi:mannose-1-phosphate guanylyltransferase
MKTGMELEQPAIMPSFPQSHPWAVVLAGGDGTRLQDLTLKIAGDSRPKQFCSIFGGESLLAQTRARIASLFPLDRELFVVTRAHEIYTAKNYRASMIRVSFDNHGIAALAWP